jgi:hypothetical protein
VSAIRDTDSIQILSNTNFAFGNIKQAKLMVSFESLIKNVTTRRLHTTQQHMELRQLLCTKKLHPARNHDNLEKALKRTNPIYQGMDKSTTNFYLKNKP